MRLKVKTQSRMSSRFHLLLFALLLSPPGAYGQNVNGSIVGTVSDSTSAAIPAATVTITDVNTNVSRTAQTPACSPTRRLERRKMSATTYPQDPGSSTSMARSSVECASRSDSTWNFAANGCTRPIRLSSPTPTPSTGAHPLA